MLSSATSSSGTSKWSAITATYQRVSPSSFLRSCVSQLGKVAAFVSHDLFGFFCDLTCFTYKPEQKMEQLVMFVSWRSCAQGRLLIIVDVHCLAVSPARHDRAGAGAKAADPTKARLPRQRRARSSVWLVERYVGAQRGVPVGDVPEPPLARVQASPRHPQAKRLAAGHLDRLRRDVEVAGVAARDDPSSQLE